MGLSPRDHRITLAGGVAASETVGSDSVSTTGELNFENTTDLPDFWDIGVIVIDGMEDTMVWGFGSTNMLPVADGDVDGEDFLIWQSQFGSRFPAQQRGPRPRYPSRIRSSQSCLPVRRCHRLPETPRSESGSNVVLKEALSGSSPGWAQMKRSRLAKQRGWWACFGSGSTVWPRFSCVSTRGPFSPPQVGDLNDRGES